MGDTMKSKESCPACGKQEGLPLVWGEADEERKAAAQRGEIILAGFVVWREFLDFECQACGYQWATTHFCKGRVS
jgi:hypothetical protein